MTAGTIGTTPRTTAGTTPRAPMGDADIHAFGVPAMGRPGAGAVAGAPRRRRWPWIVAGTAIGLVLAALALGALLLHAMAALGELAPGLQVELGGEPWWPGGEFGGFGFGHAVLAALGLLLGLVAAVIVVPLALALAAGGVVLALVLTVALGIGLPLVLVVGVLVAVTSPLWIVGLLLWLVLR